MITFGLSLVLFHFNHSIARRIQMRKIQIALTILFVLFISFSVGFAAEVGDTAHISDWQWINIKNIEPVQQNCSIGSLSLSIKECRTCGIEFGGLIEVIAKDGKHLLVKYTAPGKPIGTPCPSGIIFFIDEQAFNSMEKSYGEVKASRAAEEDTRKKFLNQ